MIFIWNRSEWLNKKKLKNLTRFSTFNEDTNLSDVRMSYTPDVRTLIIGHNVFNFNKKYSYLKYNKMMKQNNK